jgi:prepilin-type processing-associated H-X9-DG protein
MVMSFTLPAAGSSINGPNVQLWTSQSHMFKGRVDVTNQAFADGHVEQVRADALRWRYYSNYGWYEWR